MSTITLSDGGVLDLARWPLPGEIEDGVVNRAQLARAFQVSENTVTKWIGQGMPVQSEGQNGVAYEFRLSHCYAWRQSRDQAVRDMRARGDQLAAQAALAFRNLDQDQEEEEGGLTADELRKWSEAEYHRNRVAEQRGALVRAERVQETLEGLLVAFRTAQTTLPDWCEREFGLTSAQVAKLEGRCDQILQEGRMLIDRNGLGAGAGATVLPFGPGEQGQLGV